MQQRYSHNPRAEAWFTPGRFGLFYHYGLITGGGSSCVHEPGSFQPPRYEGPEALERAAPPPRELARNLVALARKAGARYITFTLMHSCSRFCILFPSRSTHFVLNTRQDFISPLLEEAHAAGLRLVLYVPGDVTHWDSPGGPWIRGLPSGDEHQDTRQTLFASHMLDLFQELRDRYGSEGIDGFWIDGTNGFPNAQPVRDLFPEALVIVNNETTHRISGMDISTTEFLTGTPDPPYNRPSALVKPHVEWWDHIQPPRADYNEDIPTCNGWFHREDRYQDPQTRCYVEDRFLALREMLCSLAMRRRWNFSLGLGPTVDGQCPALLEPTLEALGSYLRRFGEAVYDTQGGEGAPFQGGWLNGGAFGALTVSRLDPRVYYLHVTEPPRVHRMHLLMVQHAGVEVEAVTDMRTGEALPYRMDGALLIECADWSGIGADGAQVLCIRLRERNR